jgi:single-stranded-DNA-specific exonuclease
MDREPAAPTPASALSVSRRRWVAHPADARSSGALARELGISELTAQVLLNRSLSTAEAGREFLTPRLASLAPPDGLPDLEAAVDRLARAIREHERILVHGDYDVDGLSGSALLERLLRQLGADVEAHVPCRLNDGYGLRPERIGDFAARGVRLIVTVDTGTSATEAIRLAPKRADSTYPFRSLAGAGVAFHLAWALAREISGGPRVSGELRTFLTESLALVCLGTVADVVPLVGINRILVSEGLRQMRQSRIEGVRALLASCDLVGVPLRPDHVAFQLAPRLNAAGRMGRAELAHELLVTDSPERARELAAALDGENRRRRREEQRTLEAVTAQVEERLRSDPDLPIIVLGEEGWHLGVLGIVAARLVDRFHRPAMLVAFDEQGLGRASCRTVEGFALHTALAACSEHLRAHGGHAGAAGFEIQRDRFGAFAGAMESYARETIDSSLDRGELVYDAEVDLGRIEEGLVRELDRLQPFGEGNPQPVFVATGARVAGRPRRVGQSGDHLLMTVRQGGQVRRAIAFGLGELCEPVTRSSFDVAFVPGINEFRGQRELQLEVRDLRIHG